MPKTVKEAMQKYPVRVNVNGKYSHTFKLPKAQVAEKGRKAVSPLDVARRKKAAGV